MDDLEEIIIKNKESFDRIKPADNMWDSIKGNLKNERGSEIFQKEKASYMLQKVAASILVIICALYIWNNNFKNDSVFSDLTMASPDGEEIPLDPSLNKLTLIQFWASGNVICDEENCYYYLPAYEKYKEHGFEIYAISLDENKEDWIASIEKNNLPWIHVSDLLGWDSSICIECDMSKMPTSYLLDSRGNIVAYDLNAETLDETLRYLLAKN